MPGGLTETGQRAHLIILEYLQQHGLTNTVGCRAFYSPTEWTGRGEKYGALAHLIVVYDGSDMRQAFSLDAAWPTYSLYEGMQDKLCAAGLYFEECTCWYCAVYSVH